jgi:hypothetical protein
MLMLHHKDAWILSVLARTPRSDTQKWNDITEKLSSEDAKIVAQMLRRDNYSDGPEPEEYKNLILAIKAWVSRNKTLDRRVHKSKQSRRKHKT